MFTAAVVLGALANLGFAAYALILPASAAELSELDLTPAAARAEYRAVFGGLVGALGLGMLWVLARGERAGAWLLALMFGGLVFGRGVDLLLGSFEPMQLALMALEAGMAAALILWARGASSVG
ncbi:MAG: DUF4345 family protein [Planctomycetota bacterium]|jgi:hypothetical protein